MRRSAPGRPVEELPSFGKAFDHLPLKGQLIQAKTLMSGLVARYGTLGTLGVIRAMLGKRTELRRRFGETIQRDFATVPSSAHNEFFMMAGLYEALAEKEDRDTAYEFSLDLFRTIGPAVHSTLYDVDRLLECDGDPYTNFCALNRSFFERSAEKGFYDVEEISETGNLQFVRLTRCLNVDLCSAVGSPELARIGCVLDIAGYGLDGLGRKVDLDFRQPKTLVHGDDACEFYYFRAGMAPPDMETH